MAKKTKKKINANTKHTKSLIRTGIPGLDRMLGGGIAEGESYTLIGSPHCGKKPLLMKIGYTAIVKNRPVIFVLTDFGVTNWVNMMASSGWNVKKHSKSFYVVDSYSQQFGVCPSTETTKCMEVPYTLSQISIAVTDFVNKIKSETRKKPIVILHSLSTLIENFDAESVFKFMQFFLGKLRAEGIIVFYSLQSEVHSQETTKLLTSLADGIIEMEDRKIRVSDFRRASLDWQDYDISKKGIVIKPPKASKTSKTIKKRK